MRVDNWPVVRHFGFCPRTSKKRGERAFSSRRRGASLVEFALVAPLLIALLMGIMEFAILARNQLMLANAAREGVRTLSLGRTVVAAKTRIKNASSQVRVADNQITVTFSTDNGAIFPTAVSDSGTQNTAPVGSLIKVAIATPHKTLTGFFPMLRNYTLRVDATMRRED